MTHCLLRGSSSVYENMANEHEVCALLRSSTQCTKKNCEREVVRGGGFLCISYTSNYARHFHLRKHG